MTYLTPPDPRHRHNDAEDGPREACDSCAIPAMHACGACGQPLPHDAGAADYCANVTDDPEPTDQDFNTRLAALRAARAARHDADPCDAPDPSALWTDAARYCSDGAGHAGMHANRGNAWTDDAYPYAYRAAIDTERHYGGTAAPRTALQLATVDAAADLAVDDRAAGLHRDPRSLRLDAAERAGHPRTTTHPATYGACELDDTSAATLSAYLAHRYPVED